MDMSELEEKRRKWVDVTRENGFRDGITDLLAHQYSTKTHFIFELLQNAEDARATKVEFRVEKHQLVFRHNGKRLFSDPDVESITSIGKSTKHGDYTQIGKHGIGFKAVFAYTHTPRIHSGDKHFDIEDVLIPVLLNGDQVPNDVKPDETRIILPFDSSSIPEDRRFRDLVSAETAYTDISEALKKLSSRTLLFLRHIKKIRWILSDGSERIYSRKPPDAGGSSRFWDLTTDGVVTERWVVFERKDRVTDDGEDHECMVEVAFLVDGGKVMPATNTELVVYFPTEKKTGLAFLIQGPFKTTKARDNIKNDDPANRELLRIAAQLAADSLEMLCDLKLLDSLSYLALPLKVPEDDFFRPVYERIRETFRTKPLLPGHGGTFIKAEEAKLARGKNLVDLFSPEQLGSLFDKIKLFWLDPSITESGAMADLHSYLVGKRKSQPERHWEIEPLCAGLEVDAESLASKLTADFFRRQPITWLLEFIRYAAQSSSSSKLRRTPFVRLASGKQISLPENKKVPRPAWFAPDDASGLDLSAFDLVHRDLTAVKDVREFLDKEGIRELDDVAVIDKSILPKYNHDDICFDESNYRVDLCRICEAYRNANDSVKSQLIIMLDKVAWLACIHASGKEPDEIVWKQPGASNLFEKNDSHIAWFRSMEESVSYFLHSSVIETLGELVAKLARPAVTLTINLSSSESIIPLTSHWGDNKQGLNGFDPRATIKDVEFTLKQAYKNIERSKVLWSILVDTPRIICGMTQSSANRQRLNGAEKVLEYTEVGKLCRAEAWLPDGKGKWCKPSDLLLSDLSEGFESTSIAAKDVAEKLGMKQPEREQALDIVTEGDVVARRRLERFLSLPDGEQEKLLDTIPPEIPPEPIPSFKDGLHKIGRPQRGRIESGDTTRSPVSNPERYQEKLNEQVESEVEQHQSTPRRFTFSRITNQPTNVEARRFLYEQYKGCCQVTGTTFPKANKDSDGVAENYFEACGLLSYANADYLNDAGNMLCVSADTMAKFKCASVTFMESIEDAITTFKFKTNEGRAECVSIKIELAGEECYIKWSQRHFMRLVALYEKA